MVTNLPETVLQTVPSVDRSSQYRMIETKPFLDYFLGNGFEIKHTMVSRTRKPEWKGHEKHRITLGYPGLSNPIGTPTIHLLNSSNGSSQFRLMLGYLTKICSNGATINVEGFEYAVRHVGNKDKDLQTVLDVALQHMQSIQGTVQKMADKPLGVYDQWKMAEYAIGLRWEQKDIPFPVSDLLKGHRLEQWDATVWNIYNRVQENLVRGFDYRQGRRIRHVREINSIDTDNKVNAQLWDYAVSLVG